MIRRNDSCEGGGPLECNRVVQSAIPGAAVLRHRLSPHQERLWFIDEFESGNLYPSAPTYHNIPTILRWRGPLNVSWLQRGLDMIMKRHAALRTRIVAESGFAFQEITRAGLPIAVVEMLETERTAEIPDEIWRFISQPFDRGGILIRAALFCLPAEGVYLVIVAHHYIVDRESTRIVARELMSFYEQAANGRLNRVEAVRSYTDYSEWLRTLSDDS